MAGSANLIKTKKMLVTNPSSYDDLMLLSDLRVYIEGYSYIATTDRSVTVNNTITEATREDGMRYCDHDYREPTSMSYTIIVSKLDGTEYNKLKDIYTSRRLVPVKSIAYYCPNAIMSSLTVKDEYFDALKLDVTFKEVLVSGTDYTLDIGVGSSFQIFGGMSDSENISTSTNIYTNERAVEVAKKIVDEQVGKATRYSSSGYYQFTGNTASSGRNLQTTTNSTISSDTVKLEQFQNV